jgi:Protein of unknown function (DUF3237)
VWADAMPELTQAFEVRVEVAPAQELGGIGGGRRRIIPITGGTFAGARLSGDVLPGGADWQTIFPDGRTEVLARYSLRATDGTVIGVVNRGVRRGPPDVIARLTAGEIVDPSLYYFRSSPVFEVAPGPHAWLLDYVFVGVGVRRPDSVLLQVYAVDG